MPRATRAQPAAVPAIPTRAPRALAPHQRLAQKARATEENGSTPIVRSGRLVVVESPAKARTIGRYLGRGYTVKSSVGHVRDLLKTRLSVDIANDFAPDYRVPKEKKEVVAGLKDAAAKAIEIFLATDPDREGEAIAWHVVEAADMDPTRTRRVVFHEITNDAILNAFANPATLTWIGLTLNRPGASWIGSSVIS